MSVRKCFRAKGLTGPEAEEALRLRDLILDQERLNFGGETGAAVKAADIRTAKLLKRRAAEHKYQGLLQMQRVAAVLKFAERHPKGLGNGIQAQIGFDIHHRMNDVPNLETLHTTHFGDAQEVMADAIHRFRIKWAGLKRDLEGEENLVRAIFGEKTGDESESFAAGWFAASETGVAKLRLAGAIIPELSERFPKRPWLLPNPVHDHVTIALAAGGRRKPRSLGMVRKSTDADRDAWIADAGRLVEVVDFETDDIAVGLRKELILREVWETFATDGLNKIEPGAPGGLKLGNRRTLPRVLFFKDADSWLAYNRKYGREAPFSTLMHHLDRMARDIATMEIFGPNPDHAMRVIDDVLKKRRVGSFKRRQIQAQYRIASGGDGIESRAIAGVAQNIRSLLVAQQLGSASLSALSDIGFTKATAEFNGLSGVKAMKFYLDAIKGGEINVNMTRQGIVIDDMVGHVAAGARFVDSFNRGNATGRYADFILRVSGLTQMTNAGRRGIALMLHGELADKLARPFDDLARTDRAFHDMLTRYGITAEDWKLMGQAELFQWRGQGWFHPSRILDIKGVNRRRAIRVAQKVKAMVIQEQQFAVPTTNSRVEALLTVGTKKGTPEGELARFFGMYKRFPALIIHTHMMRAMFAPGRAAFQKGAYMAKVIIYTTVIGTLGYQLQQMTFGRDPAPLDDPETWVRGMLKGGALGIWGDTLFQDVTGYGRGALNLLAGPAWDFANRTVALTVGGVQRVIKGQGAKVLPAFVEFFDRFLLPGTSLWYLRLAKDRLIVDQLREMVDPNWARRRARRLRSLAASRGQGYFSLPGTGFPPERAPAAPAPFGPR